MTRNELINRYFEWMYQLVCSSDIYLGLPSDSRSYRKLLWHLHQIDFDYTMDMDGNRAEDGINLRYKFGDENRYRSAMIASYLDDRPCSVLEMMVALAIRCEDRIMDNTEIGNRTGQWFWNMIASLGLDYMRDGRFDPGCVDAVITRFLERDYAYNGEGGLFTVRHTRQDMRQVEIWYQMCMYLEDVD